MKPTTIQKIWILAVGLLSPFAINQTGVCTVNFADADSSIAIDTTNSAMAISNASKIIGWGQRSVVKATGDNASSAWIEGYTSGSIVGQAGQAGSPAVTKVVSTNLIDANSNAITVLPPTLRATSNLLLYTARTYSSSLLVLRSRADSTNVNFRGTSNAVNALYQQMAVPTGDNIDGTVFAKYQTRHHVFHNNGNAWTARGWVRFNNGFTVMPLGSVIMDTLTTVSGGFDLRDTGTLILNNDLYLAHNVTLTNGGNIKGQASSSGQANTIFMGGDLTLASTTYARTLHITGDWSNSGTSGNLIIDGCGHTLNIGDRAQIFVDTNVTLTLRNMTIKTGPKSLNNPAIQLAAHGSKLALDNVMFDLGADFHFITGQIFVHNEVAVTGTSAFVYQSPKPSYITSGATWSFEQGTTFSVAPSTFTDCPFTVNNTYTNNAFLVLADASSALSLNGCSLQTTFTGLRLRSGMVLFDNKVAIDTTAGVDLATTGTTPVGFVCGTVTDNRPRFVTWSPDGKFLAIVIYDISYTLQVYRFNSNNTLTPIGSSVPTASGPRWISWSPDGRFLAVASGNDSRIYKFNGNSTPTRVATSPGVAGGMSNAWSPDGRFLLVSSPTTIQVYRFDGVSSLINIDDSVSVGNSWITAAWSPDGRFIAATSYNDSTLKVFRFNGTSAPTQVGSTINTTIGGGNLPNNVAWSPDGRFIAVGNVNTGPNLKLYRFNGYATPMPVGYSDPGGSFYGLNFSPDGRFIATGSGNGLSIYRINGTTASQIVGSAVYGGNTIESVAWSPDGQYIALTNDTSPGSLRIFRCNYIYSGQPTQGFSNGLLFGDKRLGTSFDANVNVLAGAVVKVKGMVKDDSF